MAIDNIDVTRKDGFYITANVRGLDFSNPDGTVPGLDDQLGVIFIARHPCEVMWVSEMHTNSGTGSIMLQNTGNDVLKNAFSLTGSTLTAVTKERTALQNRQLEEGEYLRLTGSSLTETQNINITIYLKNLGRGDYR